MSYLVSATTAYARMSFCWLFPPVEFITNGILRFFVEVEAWWKVWLNSPDSMFLPLTKHMSSCAGICYHKLYTGYKNAKMIVQEKWMLITFAYSWHLCKQTSLDKFHDRVKHLHCLTSCFWRKQARDFTLCLKYLIWGCILY